MALLGTHNAIPPPVTGSSQVETTLGLHLSAKLLDCLPRPRAQHGGALSFSAWKGSRLHTARYSVLFLPLSRLCMPISPFHTHYLMTRTAQSWHKVPHAAEARGCRTIRPMSTLRNTFSTLTLSHTQILPVVTLTTSQTVVLILFPTNQPTMGLASWVGRHPLLKPKEFLNQTCPLPGFEHLQLSGELRRALQAMALRADTQEFAGAPLLPAMSLHLGVSPRA